MPRSLRVSQNFVGTVKLALKRQGFPSQRALSEDLGLALSTVNNFFNAKPIDRVNFEEICLKLALNWKEIAVPQVEELPQSEIELSSENVVLSDDKCYQDWGEAPDVASFYGRVDELTILKQWVVQDRWGASHFLKFLERK